MTRQAFQMAERMYQQSSGEHYYCPSKKEFEFIMGIAIDECFTNFLDLIDFEEKYCESNA